MSDHLITEGQLAEVVADISGKVVKNKPQSLTDAQKAQARQNIGAAGAAELTLKADKTSLALTDKKVKYLYELGKGKIYDIDTDTDAGYSKTVPQGAVAVMPQMIGGKSAIYGKKNLAGLSMFTYATCTGTIDGNNITFRQTQNYGTAYLQLYGLEPSTQYTLSFDVTAKESSYNALYSCDQGSATYQLISATGHYTRTAITTAEGYLDIRFRPTGVSGVTGSFSLKNIQVEKGSTETPFEPHLDTPIIISAEVQSIESVGFNLIDESKVITGKIAKIDTGAFTNSGITKITDYIKVEGGNSYYFKMSPINSNVYGIVWYDENKNYISGIASLSSNLPKAHVAPDNARYVVATMTISQVSPCINVSSSFNGQYKPYRAPVSLDIPSEIKSLEGYGWSAGNVYNEVNFEEKKFIKRVGRVDLGTFNWQRAQAIQSSNYYFSATLPETVKTGATGTVPKFLCAKFVPIAIDDNAYSIGRAADNSISMTNNSTWTVIRCDTYTDPAAFKAAMSGVYLYYEAAEEEVVDISAYLPSDLKDLMIDAEGGGSVTFVQQTGGLELPIPNILDYFVKLEETI